LTERGSELILNCSVKTIDELYKKYNIAKESLTLTPSEILEKYNNDDYYLSETKRCIINVLNNNLELQFHPLSAEKMIAKYKKDVKCKLDDDMIKDKL
jgi:hypothetical protein